VEILGFTTNFRCEMWSGRWLDEEKQPVSSHTMQKETSTALSILDSIIRFGDVDECRKSYKHNITVCPKTYDDSPQQTIISSYHKQRW